MFARRSTLARRRRAALRRVTNDSAVPFPIVESHLRTSCEPGRPEGTPAAPAGGRPESVQSPGGALPSAPSCAPTHASAVHAGVQSHLSLRTLCLYAFGFLDVGFLTCQGLTLELCSGSAVCPGIAPLATPATPACASLSVLVTRPCWASCRGSAALHRAAQAPPHPATLTCRACRCEPCFVTDPRARCGARGSGWCWTGGAAAAAARSLPVTARRPARGCTRRRSSRRRQKRCGGERRWRRCERPRRGRGTWRKGRGRWVRGLGSRA